MLANKLYLVLHPSQREHLLSQVSILADLIHGITKPYSPLKNDIDFWLHPVSFYFFALFHFSIRHPFSQLVQILVIQRCVEVTGELLNRVRQFSKLTQQHLIKKFDVSFQLPLLWILLAHSDYFVKCLFSLNGVFPFVKHRMLPDFASSQLYCIVKLNLVDGLHLLGQGLETQLNTLLESVE